MPSSAAVASSDDREQQPAVADEGDHRPLGRRQLGADRRRQRVAERRVPGRVDEAPARVHRQEVHDAVVRGFRAVAGEHAVFPERLVERADQRQPRRALGERLLADRLAHTVQLRRGPLGRQRRDHLARITDHGHVGAHVLVALRGIDVDADQLAAAARARAPTGPTRRAPSRSRAPRRASAIKRCADRSRIDAPSESGCRSSITPLPFTVVITGAPSAARSAPRAPPPATTTGRRAPASSRAASATSGVAAVARRR